MGFRTQAQVDKLSLPAGKADAYIWDDGQPGLSVRLKGKARTWTVWYSVNGSRRKVALGALAGLSLKDARAKAGRIVADARDGKDPLAERAAAKAATADTLGALIAVYLERRAKPKQRVRTYREVERCLNGHWRPLHDRQLAMITRRDITDRLEDIRTSAGPVAANRARSYLAGVFAWGLKSDRAEHNPVTGTEALPGGKEVTRERVLSPAELVAIWNAASDPAQGDFGAIVRLLMLTGARRDEVSRLEWGELDLEAALWRLPAARAKNKREHEVPLPRQAVALLSATPRRQGPCLFGRGGALGFAGYTMAKRRLDRALGDAVEHWTLHDLRRSAVTHMVELGIAPHVVEACVNHVSGHKGGVAGIYNRATYRPQKKAALQRWADWLEALVEGREPASNVVALR